MTKSAAVEDFIGMVEDEAIKAARDEGLRAVRIIIRDGVHFVVTRDYRRDRVNFSIENGVVVAAKIG